MRHQPANPVNDPKPVDKPAPTANPYGGASAEQDTQNPPPAR